MQMEKAAADLLMMDDETWNQTDCRPAQNPDCGAHVGSQLTVAQDTMTAWGSGALPVGWVLGRRRLA
jgi:hypothetical protein